MDASRLLFFTPYYQLNTTFNLDTQIAPIQTELYVPSVIARNAVT